MSTRAATHVGNSALGVCGSGFLVVGRLARLRSLTETHLVEDFGLAELEVVGVDLGAHLDAQVIDIVDVPGRGVAHHFAALGANDLRLGPEAVGERVEAERFDEQLTAIRGLLDNGTFDQQKNVLLGLAATLERYYGDREKRAALLAAVQESVNWPRLPVTLGMLLGMAGLVLFTQIGVDTAYATHVLPGLLVTGLGLGLVFACSFEVGTMGVEAHDSGVASAMVNTTQQVGGSVGTALLSTIFASAVAAFVASSTNPSSPATQAAAQVEGYTTAFWWAAGLFLLAAVICGLLMTSRLPEHDPDIPRVAA